MEGSAVSTIIPGLRSCTEMNGRASARHGERTNELNGLGGLVGNHSVSNVYIYVHDVHEVKAHH